MARTPYKLIAEEFGVSVRTVELVVKRFREEPSPLAMTPRAALDEFVRSMRRSVAEFEAMAARNEERAPHVALGARRSAAKARRDYISLLMAVGLMLRNLGWFATEDALRRLGLGLLEGLDRVIDGELSIEELRSRSGMRWARRRGSWRRELLGRAGRVHRSRWPERSAVT